jgi:GDP-L-fucose synthase
VGFEGVLAFDPEKPDGQPRRCLDTQKARELFGFEARVGFQEGLEETVRWYQTQRMDMLEFSDTSTGT